MKRIIRKCTLCQEKYFLKYYGRKNITKDICEYVRDRFSSEPRICDFCVKIIYVERTRHGDKEFIKLVERKRTTALLESRTKNWAIKD